MIIRLFQKIALFILFVYSTLPGLYATGRILQMEQFGIDEGLSQTAVNCVIQDSYGFLWIGTQDGLNRYDGYEFKVFRNQPLDTNSLANSYVVSLCEDSKGNIWAGTRDGLSCYIRNRGIFKNYYHNPKDISTLSSSMIYYVYEDKKGFLWVKTPESMDRFDPQTESFARFPHFTDFFSASTQNNDFVIFEDFKNKLWVGTKDGLMQFDRNLGMYKRYSHDPYIVTTISNNRIKHVFEDSEQTLWIATEVGLNRYNREHDNFFRYVYKPNVEGSLPNSTVNFVFEDSKKTIWVGTENGLCTFNKETETFSPILSLFINDRRLYATSFTSMCEDMSQVLWVGTFSGLLKWDLKEPKFSLLSKTVYGENIFSNNIIASVFSENDEWIWVGTWGTGLHRYNMTTGQNFKFSTESQKKIANDYIHVITKTSQGDILLGTRSGIEIWNPKTNSFSDFFIAKGFAEHRKHFVENRIYSIKEDKKGRLWIGTRMGLYVIDGSKLIAFHNSINDESTITSNEIQAIAFDNDGFVWVGTFNGLNRINSENFEVMRFLKPQRYHSAALASNDVLSLLFSSKGELWVGTNAGLHKYNPKTNVFKFYSEQEGLPNNLINAIEEDQNGNIWVSSNWGIAMLNYQTDIISAYSIADGLQGNEFNLGASCKSDNGYLFFGGVIGLNFFTPKTIISNPKIPKIAITNVQVIGANGSEIIHVEGLSEIEVGGNFSMINIEFAALDFTKPERNMYMYKMEGLEGEWINVGNRRIASFSNLSEGTYVFTVKGTNNDKVWNDEGVSIRIIRKTKFWKSRLAIGIYWGLFILALVISTRIRTKVIRRTNKLLKEREIAMAEVENQKEELVVKNKSITDSINYAKRIQEAIMPSINHFQNVLPGSFVLYMPKDIVSGDFYWINETNNKIFVAAVDCTGHGVPGAFMSIIGVELLRNITNVQGINDAAEILNRLHSGINDTFGKGVGDESVVVKDGMDVSFCVLDKENNIIQFAGAFTSLYLIRDNKIIEVKGDRYSVGMGNENEDNQFSSHFITVEPDDMVYIFTDGYVDQFGGPEGKKFKFRRFRHLLLSIHKLPLAEQQKQLKESIDEWCGNHEQVDDILIIGIKPDMSCLF